jgi:RNA recognition motif-containing protein
MSIKKENIEKKKQLNFAFWKIKNKEESEYVIKKNSYGFIFLGLLMILMGFWINAEIILNGLIFLVLGLLLFWLKSKIISILLLSSSVLVTIATLKNSMSTASGGTNIGLAIIILYAAIASVYATFKRGKYGSK